MRALERSWWRTTLLGGSAALVMAGAMLASGHALADPPERVGRLGFVEGTISYHDEQAQDWSAATLNYPITTGDSLWAEPGSRAEVMVGGNRLRLEGSTELDVLQLDDQVTRLQLPQGTLYIRLRDLQPGESYGVITPRGTVSLVQPGEYRIDAGTTDDPTRIFVMEGQAQFADQSGMQPIAAGEAGVISGPPEQPEFGIDQTPPPPLPRVWAERDRAIAQSQSARYVAPTVTGIEDLDAYGTWREVPDYGRAWVPRDVGPDWAPYSEGHWAWVDPWGWTWVDDAPWGFAPFHYGRWVRVHDYWAWTPPIVVPAAPRPVYAPALVGFVGGGPDISVTIGIGSGYGPAVGWFPLGPQEVYVPPYRVSPRYVRNVNVTNVTNVTHITNIYRNVTVERGRRGPGRGGSAQAHFVNQRFATVVPERAFANQQPVRRARLNVQPDRLARAPVAPVAAPPAAVNRGSPRPERGAPGPRPGANGRAGLDARAPDAPPITRTAVANMPTIGRPAAVERKPAPGPAARPHMPAPRPATARPNAGGPVQHGPGDRRDGPSPTATGTRPGTPAPVPGRPNQAQPSAGRPSASQPSASQPSASQPPSSQPPGGPAAARPDRPGGAPGPTSARPSQRPDGDRSGRDRADRTDQPDRTNQPDRMNRPGTAAQPNGLPALRSRGETATRPPAAQRPSVSATPNGGASSRPREAERTPSAAARPEPRSPAPRPSESRPAAQARPQPPAPPQVSRPTVQRPEVQRPQVQRPQVQQPQMQQPQMQQPRAPRPEMQRPQVQRPAPAQVTRPQSAPQPRPVPQAHAAPQARPVPPPQVSRPAAAPQPRPQPQMQARPSAPPQQAPRQHAPQPKPQAPAKPPEREQQKH